jgi:phosphoribosylglycinamide formyltransferase-1
MRSPRSKAPARPCSRSAASKPGRAAAPSRARPALEFAEGLVRDPQCVIPPRRRPDLRPRQQHAALVEQATAMRSCWSPRTSRTRRARLGARSQGFRPGRGTARASTRSVRPALLSAALDDHRVGTIALAGFMRILSPWFIERMARADRQHPPFPAAQISRARHAPAALEAGDKVSGCSVHLVTEELDAGEVLGQAEVPIEPGDTPASLEQRVLAPSMSFTQSPERVRPKR